MRTIQFRRKIKKISLNVITGKIKNKGNERKATKGDEIIITVDFTKALQDSTDKSPPESVKIELYTPNTKKNFRYVGKNNHKHIYNYRIYCYKFNLKILPK